ncbi:transposon Tf2-6 polyprotein [Trichonephila clavipes]|uniref:Transposon Tf2-6 polyprotein n=1 Tax=Trichonephila clavipes TaxID=2585209 RepID=A0A8X6VIR8_TRICX|nr:transposon Tf2-6 polyprotein [Trichonephila clavipes]
MSHAKSDVLLNESESSLGAYSNSIFYVANVIQNSSSDLSHVKNFNIRNDLSSLIKNYKPNKIKSNIVKDDIPVCQRARRLSCSEKLQVNDQIDDWLQQGPLQSTNKNYNHILSIIDAFTKFVWLYPVKSTSSRYALEKLKQQEITFGNPHRIITDKGNAFTSKEFREYCENENIQYVSITTEYPEGTDKLNGSIVL